MASRSPSKDPRKSDLIQRLISTPPRASYLDQKASIFAIQIPGNRPAHGHAPSSGEVEPAHDSASGRSDSAPVQHMGAPNTGGRVDGK